MAAYHRRKVLFLIALPMGLIDFFVPFAGYSLIWFEVLFFVLAVASLAVAWYVTKGLRKQQHETEKQEVTG